jgi:hypothetical protein
MSVAVYKLPDGSADCAVDDIWVSALFESPEAALSWDGFWDDAEARFRELNPPSGKGENLLGFRSCSGQ